MIYKLLFEGIQGILLCKNLYQFLISNLLNLSYAFVSQLNNTHTDGK